MPEGNFDMVRYSGELHGLSDFLHVSLINYFREQGRPGMNLGLAPFSGIEQGDARSPVGRAMRLLYSYGTLSVPVKGPAGVQGQVSPALGAALPRLRKRSATPRNRAGRGPCGRTAAARCPSKAPTLSAPLPWRRHLLAIDARNFRHHDGAGRQRHGHRECA